MKQIISYNEEYMDISVVDVIRDDENAVERFHQHMVKRTSELLPFTEEEAEDILDGYEDIATYNIINGNGDGTIFYDGFMERITMVDVPKEDGVTGNRCEKKRVFLDIDMPKGCTSCPFYTLGLIGTCGNIAAKCWNKKVEDFTETRHPECPLKIEE